MTPAARQAIESVLKHEGGYVDHPSDPGGATNRGVTIKVLAAWRGRPVTKDDVRALTEAEACQIYERNYWQAIRGDDLPTPVAFVTMDAAVNSGVSRAAQWLQQAVGAEPDGQIGPATIALVGKHDAHEIADRCCTVRLEFLHSLKTWPTFGKGWGRRVAEVKAAARSL